MRVNPTAGGTRIGSRRRRGTVVVVGAGLSGLSCALHLLGAGHDVVVLERKDHPGGRAGRIDMEGFRVDTGPTVLTMPDLLDEAFEAVGTSVHEHLELLPLAPAYRAAFADGSTVDVHTEHRRMVEEVTRLAGPREAVGYLRLRRWLTRLYQVEMRAFIDAQFDSPLDLVGPDLVRLAALGGFGRLAPAIGRHLRDDRLRRIFSFPALYAGVPPERALAAYAVIAYMDTVAGVYFPKGGLQAVGEAMASAAEEAGARVQLGTSVRWLERHGDRVAALHTDRGERLPCDHVVLTNDLPDAHRMLGHRPRRPVPHRYSPSAVVLHLGTDRTWDRLAHHTILFGQTWERTFTEIIDRGTTMRDPSLLVTRPTLTDPSRAHPGRHLPPVLAPAPEPRGGAIHADAGGAAD